MPHSEIDKTINRKVLGEFSFPLGVSPLDEVEPRQGCTVEFEPADGGDEGGLEEWPDRYAFDIVITSSRLEPLCRSLFTLLPSRVYPILDVLGNDAYREVDPYISFDLIGFDRFIDEVARHRDWFYEDGLVGFGAMGIDPFIYIFVDEHKIVTIRVETQLRERVEEILSAFDVEIIPEPVGVDSAVHEHVSVLVAPPEKPELMSAEEIIESLQDAWRLKLNIDPATNLDERGADLGVTCWRCLVRLEGAGEETSYLEVDLTAPTMEIARQMSMTEAVASREHTNGVYEPAPATSAESTNDGSEEIGEDDTEPEEWLDLLLVSAERVTPDEFVQLLKHNGVETEGVDPAELRLDVKVYATRKLAP